MNNTVEVYNVNPLSLSGSKDGYSYKLIQVTDEGLCYTMTNPYGDTKGFVINSKELVGELIESPMMFWAKYIGI